MAKGDRVKKMALNRDEILASETMGSREEPDLQSDNFSPEEAKEIVRIVLDDVEVGYEAQKDWQDRKEIELMHVNAERPSRIENLKKRSWMSDRNLGLLPGILDIYQATLLATCYNPQSLHFIATEKNDRDNRDVVSRFTRWGLSEAEADFFPEVDDYIHNKSAHGFSCFKIYWEVRYQWVDKRIPVYSKKDQKKRVVVDYKIKTEQRRFERGVIKNIDNIDDILIPAYGKDVQNLPFFVEIMHLTFNDLKDMDDMGMLENFDEKEFLNRFRAGLEGIETDDIRHKKLDLNKFSEISNERLSNTIIDLYLWHGEYEKDGKREKYQFMIEPIGETLLFGKPVRKLNRSGKIPYVCGGLRKVPGMLKGGSLIWLIAPLINALNNNYNQTSDFQYIENLPFGFANLSELTGNKGVFELEPGVIFNVDDENIQNKVHFPNLGRSMAWSYQDKDFIMQMIERLTGAASYFLTTDSDKATATRDAIVNEKGETKFGLWVKRIMSEVCEAVNMWLELYQDNAPVGLGERVLGEDGEQLFTNLSIDDLRGKYRPQMKPDITHGSKAYEQKLAMWGMGLLQNSLWFHPEINPRGNWKITEEGMRKMGYQNPDEYLPPQPPEQTGRSKEVDQEFLKMKQGDIIDPPEGVTPMVVEHYMGHMRQKEEKYNEIPEEYRPNFDAHLFTTFVNFMEYGRKRQEEAIANRVAMNAVSNIQRAATPAPEGAPMGREGAVRGLPGEGRPMPGMGGVPAPGTQEGREGDIAL